MAGGPGMDQAAKEGHEEGCSHSLAAHIPGHASQVPVRHEEGIVKITSNFPGGFEQDADLPSFHAGKFGRQETILDLTPDLHLTLQALEIQLLQVVQALPF